MINESEVYARRCIEDATGYVVHDANVVLHANCRNIDLIVYAPQSPVYVQVKASNKPAQRDFVLVHGAPFKEDQLYGEAPIYNRHDGWRASVIAIVHKGPDGRELFLAPIAKIERAMREHGHAFAERPKRDGTKRSVAFRGELPRKSLLRYRDNFAIFG